MNQLSPEDRTNFLSRFVLAWVSPLVTVGYKRKQAMQKMEMEDLYNLRSEDDARALYPTFKKHWEAELLKPVPSIQRALTATVRPYLLKGGAAMVVVIVMTLLVPKAFEYFLKVLSNYDGHPLDWRRGIGAVLLMFSAQLASIFALNQHQQYTLRTALMCKMLAQLAVFEKVQILPAVHEKTGLVLNICNADTQKFVEFAIVGHYLWASPVLLFAALGMLYDFIGWPAFPAFGFMLLTVPFQGAAAKTMLLKRRDAQIEADKRVDLLNEAVQGIRIVKFMVWEIPFFERISMLRAQELAFCRKSAIARTVFLSLAFGTPPVVTFIIFYTAWATGTVLTPRNVFPTLSTLQLLRLPFALLPMGISMWLQILVSLKRLQDLCDPKVTRSHSSKVSTNSGDVGVALRLENVVLEWNSNSEETPVVALTVPRLVVPNAALVMVVGATGAGKSALMQGILGEIRHTAGILSVNGGIAYASQESWIMNATIRDNIILSSEFVRERYDNVIETCQLRPDLAMLAGGDLTEIGEKGINLSGGQKQRLSLARAVYSNRDICLMDDPLSAVDGHVATALFKLCIQGTLRTKTRILVTHQVQFLPMADIVVVIDKAVVVFCGTFRELQESGLNLTAVLQAQGESSKPLTPTSKASANSFGKDFASPDAEVDFADIVLSARGSKPPSVVSQSKLSRRSSNCKGTDHAPPPTPSGVQQAMNEVASQGSGSVAEEEHHVVDSNAALDEGRLVQQEEAEIGRVKWGVYRYYIRSYGVAQAILTFFLFLGYQIVYVSHEYWLTMWADRSAKFFGFRPNMAPSYHWWPAGFALLVVGIQMWLPVRGMVMVNRCLHAASSIHEAMAVRVLNQPISFFDTTPAGRILTRFSKDLDVITSTLMDILPPTLSIAFNVISVLLMIAASNVYLFIAVPIAFILYWRLLVFYTACYRGIKRLENVTRAPVTSLLGATLDGLATVRAYQLQMEFSTRFDALMVRECRPVYFGFFVQFWMTLRMELVSSLLVAVTAVLAVSNKIHNPRSPVGVSSLAITYGLQLTMLLNNLTRQMGQLDANMSSVERVREYSQLEPEAVCLSDEGMRPLPDSWPSSGHVLIQDLKLRYREGLPLVLNGVMCDITPRSKVGVVGRTGSGKSTLMLALLRIINPESGTVFIDGVDCRCVPLDRLRRCITIIPQDPLLFSGTIRSNLDPFNLNTDDAIWDALAKVHLTDRIVQEDLGLLAAVAEKGSNFSVGQRQLMCMARALLKHSNVLLMDEATASVDFETDKLIQETIRKEFSHCTILTIAHRLITVMDCDRILVMESGQVAEYASPGELVRKPTSIFSGMVAEVGVHQQKILIAIAEGKASVVDALKSVAEEK